MASSHENPLHNPGLDRKISEAQDMVHMVQNQRYNLQDDLNNLNKNEALAAVSSRVGGHDLGIDGDIESLSEIPELDEIGLSSTGPPNTSTSQR